MARNTKESIINPTVSIIIPHFKNQDILHNCLDSIFASDCTESIEVIIVDNGLQVFSSSKFHHGEEVVESGGNYYRLYHSKIYKTDANGTLNYEEGHGDHPTNVRPLDLSITKSVVMMIVTGILLILFHL